MNYDIIGEFIALKRKEKGLTQKELAFKIGVTDKAVSKWERGLGCPDVSLLEILSHVLDVSILEILKGRNITNEIIKVTEANDYVNEGLNYSKLKVSEFASKIVFIIIIFLGIFLIILNIFHIIYLNSYEEYNFDDNQTIKQMNNNIKQIEENINIIKSHQGIFTDDDYSKLIIDIDNVFDTYKNIPFLRLSGIQKFKLSDLYLIDMHLISQTGMMQGYGILSKYNEKIDLYLNLHRSTLMTIYYLKEISSFNFNYIYQYRIPNFYDSNIITSNGNNVSSRIMYFNYLLNSYLYYTEQIIEVGGLYE